MSLYVVFRYCFIVAAATSALVLSSRSHAVTTLWNTNSSGSFTVPGNWDNGVPDSDDRAVFNRGSVAYEVNFPGGSIFDPPPNYLIEELSVRTNEVSFTFVDVPFQSVPSVTVDTPILIGESAGDVAILNTRLNRLSAHGASIAHAPGSEGTLNVNGVFEVDDGLFVGFAGNGTMNINAGGQVVGGFGTIGVTGSKGIVTVSTGSMWTMTGNVIVGGGTGSGTLIIENGGSVSSAGGTIGSNGIVTVTGAGSTWMNPAELHIGGAASAVLNIADGANVSSPRGFIGSGIGFSGAVNIDGPGSELATSGDVFVGSPFVSAAHPTLTVSNGGTASFGGLLNIESSGTVLGNGNLSGNVINRGLVSPGTSTGALHINGIYIQNAAGRLLIELSGTIPETGYDQLYVSSAASFAGTLELSLINGFMPSAGDSFDIIDAAIVNGTFSSVTLPALAAGLSWDVSRLYASGELRVIGAVPGDYNQNGTVDAADYAVWRRNLGSGTSLPNDDTAGVGPDDYSRWRANFGRTAGGGSGATAGLSSSAVPEPTGLTLLVVTASALMASHRLRLVAQQLTVSVIPRAARNCLKPGLAERPPFAAK